MKGVITERGEGIRKTVLKSDIIDIDHQMITGSQCRLLFLFISKNNDQQIEKVGKLLTYLLF